MPKLLWVLLPLLATGAWLAVAAWRRQMPSRHALNVLFSVLLLGYVGGTAGLGIFWVANQQLPVFDWHYLFGYATVLLLVLHLLFNFRIVWQFLRRHPPAAHRPAPADAALPARRPALRAAGGLAGLAATAAAGYWLGLRHGRTELRIAVAAPAASGGAGALSTASRPAADNAVTDPQVDPGAAEEARAAAWALVERFHAFSAHTRRGVLRRAPGADWGDPPPPFKIHRGATRLPLPSPHGHRARTGPPGGPDAATFGALLWHAAGISERRGTLALRTSPSSGALFATELYLALPRALAGLQAGWWHYEAEGHALERLPTRRPLHASAGPSTRSSEAAPSAGPPASGPQAGPATTDAAALGLDPDALPAGASACIVATAIFRRSGHKYRDRTYRYVLADLGHALENLRVAAAALGLHAQLLQRFDGAALAAAIGLDEREEGVLAVLPLRRAAGGGAPSAREAAEARLWRPPTFSDRSGPLGLTEAVHRATSLQRVPGAGSRAVPRPASTPADALRAGAVAPPSACALEALPSAQPAVHDMLALIARRRSVRRFAATPLALPQLASVLAEMLEPAALLSPALRVDMLSAAVEGLEPAAWRVEPQAGAPALRLRVRHPSGLRERARAAALDQDVIGDAAVVFVFSLARAALLAAPDGPARAWRHGFLEAGLVGERLYLAAGARGLGVCAVGAFYDDEAAALVGIDPAEEWVVHFAALGIPG